MKFNSIFILIFIIISGINLTSCQKLSDSQKELGDGKTALLFDLQGVSGISETIEGKSQSHGNLIGKNNLIIAQRNISEKIYSGDADFLVHHEEYEVIKDSLKNNAIKAKGQVAAVPFYPDGFDPLGSATSRPLEAGIKYRMLVYRKSDNAFIGESTAIVGQSSPRIVVDFGVEYLWYAYSYNSKDDLPNFSPSNTKVSVKNEDLLYAKGTIIPNQIGDNKVPITFSHQMAMVEVMAYTIGYSAEPNLANFGAVESDLNKTFVNVPNIRSGNFDLLTSAFDASSITNLTTYSETLLNSKSASGNHMVDPIYPNTSVRGYVYSVPSTSTINTSILIRMGVKMDYNDSTRFIAPTSGIAINNLKLTAGRLSRIVIMPLEKGIPVGTSTWSKGYLYQHTPNILATNNTKWSSNERFLWMRHLTPRNSQMIAQPSTLKVYGQRFIELQNLNNTVSGNYDARKYFFYNIVYPRSRVSDLVANTHGDPCEKTYAPMANKIGNVTIPRNWRTPTIAEGTILMNAINAGGSRNKISYNGTGQNTMIFTHYPNAADMNTLDGWFNGGLIFYLDGYYKNDSKSDPAFDNWDGFGSIQGFRGTPYVGTPNDVRGATYIWLTDPQGFRLNNGYYPSLQSIQPQFMSKALRITYNASLATNQVQAAIVDMPYVQALTVRCVRAN